MKCVKFSLIAAVALAISAYGSLVSAQNLLSNPGFEDPIVAAPGPFVGRWEPFSNGGANGAGQGSAMPLHGQHELNLVLGDPNGFAGAFQDVPVTVGSEYTWCGSHKLLSGNPGGSEIRIEWKNANDGEISRSVNNGIQPISDYTKWSVTGIAPAGAVIGRVVYNIQSFGAAPPQNVLVDDVSFSLGPCICIPEPTSMVLVGLAGVALLGFRRSTK